VLGLWGVFNPPRAAFPWGASGRSQRPRASTLGVEPSLGFS
jgi:hypothetical protein